MRRVLSLVWVMIAALAVSVPSQAIKVYFNNPGNWPAVNAYIYTKSAPAVKWPGVAMSPVTGVAGVYEAEVPAGYENAMVIFNNNDNGKQYPGANADGVTIPNKSMICWANADGSGNVTGATWTEYIDHAITVYFDNTNNSFNPVKLYYWGFTMLGGEGFANSVTMEKEQGNVYKYTTLPAGTVGMIFTNGNTGDGNQTANMVPAEGHVYNNNGDQGEYTAPTVQEDFVIYFDNTAANWATPYIHYWGGNSESTYPGVEMTDHVGKMYSFTVPGGTTGILFNAGDGDASKTNNFAPKANHVYTQAGDQGDKASYTASYDAPEHLYILGNVGEVSWDTATGVELTRVGTTGVYKGEKIEINPAAAGQTVGYITLVTVTGANWDAVNAGPRYGATTSDAELSSGVAANVMKFSGNNAGSANSWKLPCGEYTIEMDFEAMQIKATLTKDVAAAGNATLTIPDVTIEQGNTEDLAIRIVSDIPMMGLQFELELPDAASGITCGTPVLSDLMTSDFECKTSTVGGKLRFLIYSAEGNAFSRLNGALLYLPLTAAAGATEAEHTVTMSQIIISDENMNQAVVAGTVTGKVSVVAKTSEYTVSFGEVEQVALAVGDTKQLVVTTSDGAPAVTWMSSNTAVATVSSTGEVTGVANGTAIITASCGTAKASVTVTVGKFENVITWPQTVTTLAIGESIDLVEATATSGETVTFAITAGGNFATLVGNKLTAGNIPGTVTIQARQSGNGAYAPANPVTKTFTITLGYTPGDVDGTGTVNITDVSNTVAYILETLKDEALTNFNTKAADMDGNGEINIVDVTRIVALALKAAPASPAPRHESANTDGMERFSIAAAGSSLDIMFTNMDNYVATQFDLDIADNQIVGAFISGSDHRIAFRNNDGFSRVIAYSEENEPFANDAHITVVLKSPVNGEVTLNHAIVNSFADGAVIESPALGAATTITGIDTINAAGNDACAVYTVDGICVYQGSLAAFRAQGRTGLYLIRVNGKVEKLVIR